ncbi:glycine oxidase ThiO [Persicimonas caeni]|uniref:glycine oxidase ThiO n=1 Tax=Persicimonas caeni TaxID=2292766 RepID=UPI00143CCCE0|nr:glycine oxidase ThiO [Persicimonas caeni]
MNHDIAIIGAGVAGLATGWRLAQRGFDVGIFERDEPGSGASRAAAGMLAPTAEVKFGEGALLRLQRDSLARFGDFADELREASGVDIDYRTEGSLVVALEPDDTERLERIWAYQRELGLDARRLSGPAARDLEPRLAPSVHSAVLCPDDHQVDAWKLVDALTEAFTRAGGTLHTHTSVDAIARDHRRVRGLRLADTRCVEASTVVVAAGAWSGGILGVPELDKPTVRPVKGQALCLVDNDDAPLCRHVIRAPDAYLVPKNDGSIVVGATMEERGFDARLTAGGIFELLRGAWRAMPGIYDLELRDTWAGFRPISLDDAPLLGPSKIDGLWIASGHGRHGILLSAITGDVMSEAIAAGELPARYAAFAPTRFG